MSKRIDLNWDDGSGANLYHISNSEPAHQCKVRTGEGSNRVNKSKCEGKGKHASVQGCKHARVQACR